VVYDMESDNIVYAIVIQGRECGFFLERQEEGKLYLIIPDCGGMADMIPRRPEQLAWLEPRIEKIQGATHIWPTIWDLNTPEAVAAVENMLQQEGKVSDKQRSNFY
jgi:hypothetical protein